MNPEEHQIDDAAAAAQAAEEAAAQAAAQNPVSNDAPQGGTVPKAVFLHQLNKEKAKTRSVEEQAAQQVAQAQREAAEYKALLERLQAKPDADGTVRPAATTAPRPQGFTQADVHAEAQALVFHQDTTAVMNAGLADFADFKNALGVLNAVGATDDTVVYDLLGVDKANAHKILHYLAQDENIETAASIASMDSRGRIAALTRISDKMTAKPAAQAAEIPAKVSGKAISKAPPPKPLLDGVSGPGEGEEFSDEVSDEQWSKNWNTKFNKKRA